MDVKVTRDRLQPAEHGLRVPRDHRDRSEDIQALPARQAKPEVRTTQLVGAGLQHADVRIEGDERVLLIFDPRRDPEAREESLRVTTELPHQVAVAPQLGGADQAAHSINSLCREMIKVCRKCQDSPRTLDDPVYNVLRDSRHKREEAMNAQHFDVLIIGAGLSGIGTACQVQAEFPDKTIAVLERRERLGGTWDLFRYPGIRSDSDMYTSATSSVRGRT